MQQRPFQSLKEFGLHGEPKSSEKVPSVPDFLCPRFSDFGDSAAFLSASILVKKIALLIDALNVNTSVARPDAKSHFDFRPFTTLREITGNTKLTLLRCISRSDRAQGIIAFRYFPEGKFAFMVGFSTEECRARRVQQNEFHSVWRFAEWITDLSTNRFYLSALVVLVACVHIAVPEQLEENQSNGRTANVHKRSVFFFNFSDHHSLFHGLERF